MRGISAHQQQHQHHLQQQHLVVRARPPWVLGAVMHPSSPTDGAGDVNPYDRWRQWAMSVQTKSPPTSNTSRESLITCRVDKRAMRHMILFEADDNAPTTSPVPPSRRADGALLREDNRGTAAPPVALPLAPTAPPAPRLPPPVRNMARHDDNPTSPRSPLHATAAYPNLVRDSTAEAAMDAHVRRFIDPDEAVHLQLEGMRLNDSTTKPAHEEVKLKQKHGGSIDAKRLRPGSCGPTMEEGKRDSRDLLLSQAVAPGPFSVLRQDDDAKDEKGSVLKGLSSPPPEGVDEGGRRTVLPAPTTLQQMVGKKVCIVRRSEVVDAYHKGRAMEVVCPCCATSLIAPSDAGPRVMIYCPECETIAPSTLCVER